MTMSITQKEPQRPSVLSLAPLSPTTIGTSWGALTLVVALFVGVGCGSDPSPGQQDALGQSDTTADDTTGPARCESNLDCDGGEVCRESLCRVACSSTNDCTAPLPVCDVALGYCVGCITADDCGPSQGCIDGGCAFVCDADEACGPGDFCDLGTGACAARQCEESSDCAGGFRCDRFTCKPIDPIICEPGALSCDVLANALNTCNTDGTRQTPTPCGGGRRCVADDTGAECADVLCAPNAVGCVDLDSAFTCDSTGTSKVVTPCLNDDICDEGGCRTPICAPGEARCQGAGLMTCNDNGLKEDYTACADAGGCATSAFGCACVTGACQARLCAPGTTRCADAGIETCAPDGNSWLAAVACPESESCVPALKACASSTCSAQSSECFGEILAICDASGTARTTTDCATAAGFCDAQATIPGCQARVCEPNSVRCDAARGAVITCDTRGAVATTTTCLEAEVCLGGACVERTSACPTAAINVNEGHEVAPDTTLHLSSRSSTATVGTVGRWEWSVVQPNGSAGRFLPTSSAQDVTFQTNLVGQYVFSLRVWDSSGTVSCNTASYTVTVVSDSDAGIRVELLWHNPADADETDTGFDMFGNSVGADLDLHLLHPDATGDWFHSTFDCNWLNTNPSWGAEGSLDDPKVLRDDTDGAGPEIIVLPRPEPGAAYRVGIHYWDEWGFGPSVATIRVYIYGELREEWSGIELVQKDLWDALTIAWPSATITRVLTNGQPSVIHNLDPAQ